MYIFKCVPELIVLKNEFFVFLMLPIWIALLIINSSCIGIKSPGEPLVCLPPLEAFPHDPRVISRERSADYQFPPSPFTGTVKGTTEEDLV